MGDLPCPFSCLLESRVMELKTHKMVFLVTYDAKSDTSHWICTTEKAAKEQIRRVAQKYYPSWVGSQHRKWTFDEAVSNWGEFTGGNEFFGYEALSLVSTYDERCWTCHGRGWDIVLANPANGFYGYVCKCSSCNVFDSALHAAIAARAYGIDVDWDDESEAPELIPVKPRK